MWVRGDWALEVGGRVCESEKAEEQRGHPEDQESTGYDTGAETRADIGAGTSRDNKESGLSIPPVKARRDAFI